MENPYTEHGSGKPLFKLPRLACDTHCHVFGPFDRFPLVGSRKYTPEEVGPEKLLAHLTGLGVERTVVVQASVHGVDNRATLAAIAMAPDRLRGICNIDDSVTDRDLRDMHEAGIRGIRFNFNRNLGSFRDLDLVKRSVDRIVDLPGWHLVMQIDGEDVPELDGLVRGLKVPFIIDHMGRVSAKAGTGQSDFIGILKWMKLDRAWIKLSCAERMAPWPYTEALPYARALLEARIDRVLWGLDYPHPNLKVPVDDVDLVNLIPKYTESEAERQALLVDNPARLYGFS